MSDTKKFPAIGLLAVFGVGSAAAAVSLAGFGWLMVKQGLTQEPLLRWPRRQSVLAAFSAVC